MTPYNQALKELYGVECKDCDNADKDKLEDVKFWLNHLNSKTQLCPNLLTQYRLTK
jgi:hypothetical protein